MPPRLVNLMYSSYISFVYWPTKFIRKTSNKDGCLEQWRSARRAANMCLGGACPNAGEDPEPG